MSKKYDVKPLPGVREAIERKNVAQAKQMAQVLESALNRVRNTLQSAIAQALQVN